MAADQINDATHQSSNDAAYRSLLMQNHRLRVQLMLERKGISTVNMDLKALQYINDGFKVGFTPEKIAEFMADLMPIWEAQSETRFGQRKEIHRAG